jgi:hypothetical protein
MWLLAWVWSLIPTSVISWIVNCIIIAGLSGVVAGWLGKWIPFYGNYVRFLKPIGVILLVIGVYMKGSYANESAHRAEQERLQELVKQSEEKSKQVNTDLIQAVKDKEEAAKNQKIIIQERIKVVKQKIDADCKIDVEAIDILNDSAKTPKAKSKK